MKRQLIAALLGSAFALPALAAPANYEIDAGYPPIPYATGKSVAQVHQELIAAQQSGDWKVNASLGTQSRLPRAVVLVAKSRAEVRAELEQAYRTGDMIANAELGTTFNHL
jgi:hypothetical protein